MDQSRKMDFGRYDGAPFLSFFLYASGSVVVPVAWVALARELGFSLRSGGISAGGALHFGRTGAIVASMLLCGFTWLMGYLSDRTGDLSRAFYLVPACYLTLVLLIAFDRWGRRGWKRHASWLLLATSVTV